MTNQQATRTWQRWLERFTDPDSELGCLLLPAGILTFLGLTLLPLVAIIAFLALQAAANTPATPPPAPALTILETTVTPAAALPAMTAPTALPPTATTPPADLPAYAPEAVAAGERAYTSLCTACHGPDARGLPNLGKDLIDSEFVRSQSDRELQQFIIMGRPIWDPANTTGVDMPPRGGNPALSNEDILNIIAYLRVISGQGVFAEGAGDTGAAQIILTATATPTVTLAPPTVAPPTVTAASAPESEGVPAGSYDPAAIAAGERAYTSLCTACHGPDARGLPNLGKDLVNSEFVRSLSDRELQQFIITGRPIWDAANTTGVDMPPRGGNPALSNEDILNIIAYLRSLQPAP